MHIDAHRSFSGGALVLFKKGQFTQINHSNKCNVFEVYLWNVCRRPKIMGISIVVVKRKPENLSRSNVLVPLDSSQIKLTDLTMSLHWKVFLSETYCSPVGNSWTACSVYCTDDQRPCFRRDFSMFGANYISFSSTVLGVGGRKVRDGYLKTFITKKYVKKYVCYFFFNVGPWFIVSFLGFCVLRFSVKHTNVGFCYIYGM